MKTSSSWPPFAEKPETALLMRDNVTSRPSSGSNMLMSVYAWNKSRAFCHGFAAHEDMSKHMSRQERDEVGGMGKKLWKAYLTSQGINYAREQTITKSAAARMETLTKRKRIQRSTRMSAFSAFGYTSSISWSSKQNRHRRLAIEAPQTRN